MDFIIGKDIRFDIASRFAVGSRFDVGSRFAVCSRFDVGFRFGGALDSTVALDFLWVSRFYVGS